MKRLHRRTFIVAAARALVAAPLASVAGCVEPADDGAPQGSGGSTSGAGGSSTGCCDPDDPSSGGEESGEGTTSGPGASTSTTSGGEGSSSGEGTTGAGDSSSSGGSACEPTPSDIEGPFYRPGIPVGSDLDVHGDAGNPLAISGRVFDEDCQPIQDAVVEIWHATPVGPGAEPGDVNATYDESDAYRYYGQVATDAEGRFAFDTLRPGWYLNGNQYRPAHVHLKVWVGDQERLTTQLYFVDDPFNATDTWFNPLMALDPSDQGEAQIDIVV